MVVYNNDEDSMLAITKILANIIIRRILLLEEKRMKDTYRVSDLSCPEAGVCKSAILRGFLNVFSLFGPCKVGEISFRYY